MRDLISRQAAINTLKMDYTIIPYAKAREYVKATLDEIWDRLDKLPTAVSERPKGKWKNDGGPFLNRWICSECGYKHYLQPTKFCAGCGSEMTEEEDGND